MEDGHLTLETLAKWLSGGLEHDDVLSRVVPHFLVQCPECRGRYEEILRLQKDVGHWSEEVAVIEGRQAPELWSRLAGCSYDEQVRKVEEDEDLHAWGICQFLLKRSMEAVFEDPASAVDHANLAIKIAGHLGDAYDPNWVLDLRARCFAHLGNARRVLGELRSARDAFRKAERCLARSATGSIQVKAEIVDLKSSFLRAQRRLPEALELVELALGLYRENENPHGIGKCLLAKVQILSEMGSLEEAIELLSQLPSEIDPVDEPRLFAYARYNLLGCLTLAGRHREAEQLLPEVRALFQDAAQPLDLVRLRWAEGLIALGLGRPGPAEAAFREVRQEFLDRGMGYDAALVSLDLARLYAQEGCKDELKRLAAGLMPIFEARDIQRETLVSLLLFQRAAEEERVTVELIRQIAEHLRRERRGSGGGV